MHAFVFCFLVLLFSLSIASFDGKATKSLSGFSVDLIHHDSPLSPYYNPSLTPSERIKNAALRSIARSKRLGLSQNENENPKTITTPDAGNGEYLMRFYIGTPPVERFATADTGSDLIWVQCSPCKKCSPQDTPLFDPRKSSTFRSVSCDSQPCTLLSQYERSCTKSGECQYSYLYGDKTNANGKLGVDSIHFDPKGMNKSIQFPMFTFGCTYNISEEPDDSKRSTGLVVLGAGPLSLISQLGDRIGYKFSYCLVPFDSNHTSKLKFGNDATIKGKGLVSTPLILKSSQSSYYFVNLEAISIGKKKTETNKTEPRGNLILDSGTSLTVLHQSIFTKFVNLVKEVYGVEEVKNHSYLYDFCFRNAPADTDPDIVLHFTGAKLRLNVLNLFALVDDGVFCMLLHGTSEDGFNILGNQAQSNFQVEYDLPGGKVSFAPADCTKH